MSRRVVLVIGQLQQGGAEGQMALLARGLLRGDFLPSVACLSEVSEPHATALRRDGVEVTLFPRRGHRDLGRVRALTELLRRTKADLVHSFLVGANAYAYAASRLAGVRGLIASSRTTMPMRSRSSRLVHSWVFRHSSKVIANAETVKEFTADHYGVSRSAIRVVRNGVETREAGASDEERSRVRREFGAPAECLLVGTVGRLSREKNLDLFVDLARNLARENSSVRFVVVGDGPCRAELERLIREAGIADKVAVTGARSDVPRLLASMDIFVMTSDTEGLPNAILEAMAVGVPVVATRVGGVHELVADGLTGHLVPRGDVVSLLIAVRALAADATLRRREGIAARAKVEKEFSVARMIEATTRVYDEVLSGIGRRRGGGASP